LVKRVLRHAVSAQKRPFKTRRVRDIECLRRSAS
jgi:hypothetical protein